jgi:hypothetical protein
MNSQAAKEIFNELFSHLERLETQNEAILQFLKEKRRVTDKQLAPYLERAGNASNVRWRAARVRIEHLLEPEEKPEQEQGNEKPDAQAKHDQKSDSGTVHHPTEATAELAEQKDAEPAAQLNSKETNKDQEAA